MSNSILSDYLETGKAPDMATAEDEMMLLKLIRNVDLFKDLLAHLCVIEMLAKDFHYRAKGKSFYGEHLLADLIVDIAKASDDINEIRFMGELHVDPPFRADIARVALGIFSEIPVYPNEDGLIRSLFMEANKVIGIVEKCKQENDVKSGTASVLDSISQKALQVSGFLQRVMTNSDMSTEIDADSAEEAAAKAEEDGDTANGDVSVTA